MQGGCTCRALRYERTGTPITVHCCHCRWCQRQSGSAFAINAVYETARVATLSGAPEIVLTASPSGKGQKIARCPSCRIAVWSNYAGFGDAFRFVRVGSLDEPDRLAPDLHIFTASKQPWVQLPPVAVAVSVNLSLIVIGVQYWQSFVTQSRMTDTLAVKSRSLGTHRAVGGRARSPQVGICTFAHLHGKTGVPHGGLITGSRRVGPPTDRSSWPDRHRCGRLGNGDGIRDHCALGEVRENAFHFT
jgi:hypothetical protein